MADSFSFLDFIFILFYTRLLDFSLTIVNCKCFVSPEVLLTVCSALALYNEAISLSLPLLDDDGVQLTPDAVYLLALPPAQGQQAVVERAAAVGTYVEQLRVLLDGLHNLT